MIDRLRFELRCWLYGMDRTRYQGRRFSAGGWMLGLGGWLFALVCLAGYLMVAVGLVVLVMPDSDPETGWRGILSLFLGVGILLLCAKINEPIAGTGR